MADLWSYVEGTSPAKIKVIGTGGAGCNAVNNLIDAGLDGVDFIVANTDVQALNRSKALNRIQLGPKLTNGLGAGGDAERGREAARESRDQIRAALDGADMVFIATGLGGGTGTGSAPIIAEICQDVNALTVAVVTTPFSYELARRAKVAAEGLTALKEMADTVITIPNERLRTLAAPNVRAIDMFKMADEVLINSVKGVSELILRAGYINRDFADLRRVMTKSGLALMGIGAAEGENRAQIAAERALSHPLLEGMADTGARAVLINITATMDLTMEEMTTAQAFITEKTGAKDDAFCGLVYDENMGNTMSITVIAAGIAEAKPVVLPQPAVRSEKKSAAAVAPKLVAVPPPPVPEDLFKDVIWDIPPSIMKQDGARAEAGQKLAAESLLDTPTFMRKQAVN